MDREIKMRAGQLTVAKAIKVGYTGKKAGCFFSTAASYDDFKSNRQKQGGTMNLLFLISAVSYLKFFCPDMDW